MITCQINLKNNKNLIDFKFTIIQCYRSVENYSSVRLLELWQTEYNLVGFILITCQINLGNNKNLNNFKFTLGIFY